MVSTRHKRYSLENKSKVDEKSFTNSSKVLKNKAHTKNVRSTKRANKDRVSDLEVSSAVEKKLDEIETNSNSEDENFETETNKVKRVNNSKTKKQNFSGNAKNKKKVAGSRVEIEANKFKKQNSTSDAKNMGEGGKHQKSTVVEDQEETGESSSSEQNDEDNSSSEQKKEIDTDEALNSDEEDNIPEADATFPLEDKIKHVNDDNFEDLSDDSDAPVEIGFQDTKNEALSKLQSEKNQIKVDQEHKKMVRKAKHEKFVMQKQQKHEQKLRLPDDVLEELDEADDDESGTEEGEEAEDCEPVTVQKVKKIEKSFTHGSTDFKVYDLNEEVKKPYDAAEDAAMFKKNMLNRNSIKREAVSVMKSNKKKQKVAGVDKFSSKKT